MNRKYDLIQRLGFLSTTAGWFFSFAGYLDGYTTFAIISFIIGVIGIYLMYYPYPRMKNIVAVPERFKDVYYDEKGLYYDIPGKPYLLKWDEVKGYNIVSVEEVEDTDEYKVGMIIPLPILFSASLIATSVGRFIVKLVDI